MRHGFAPEAMQIAALCAACVGAIAIYGLYRCNVAPIDPLRGPMIGPIDGWAMTHIVFYGALAFAYPHVDTLALIAILGMLWEAFEIAGTGTRLPRLVCRHPELIHPITGDRDTWWYGRWEDIFWNTVGMAVGVALRALVA